MFCAFVCFVNVFWPPPGHVPATVFVMFSNVVFTFSTIWEDPAGLGPPRGEDRAGPGHPLARTGPAWDTRKWPDLSHPEEGPGNAFLTFCNPRERFFSRFPVTFFSCFTKCEGLKQKTLKQRYQRFIFYCGKMYGFSF